MAENNDKVPSKLKSRTFWVALYIIGITSAGMVLGKVGWMEGITVMSGVFGAFKLLDTVEKVKNGNDKKNNEEVKK